MHGGGEPAVILTTSVERVGRWPRRCWRWQVDVINDDAETELTVLGVAPRRQAAWWEADGVVKMLTLSPNLEGQL